jgi:hypothetical protein
MVALNERLPDGCKLLPPAGQPDRVRGGAARYGSWSPTAAPPAPPATPARRPRGSPSGTPTASGRSTCTPTNARWAQWPSDGAEALRTWTTNRNPVADTRSPATRRDSRRYEVSLKA